MRERLRFTEAINAIEMLQLFEIATFFCSECFCFCFVHLRNREEEEEKHRNEESDETPF